MGASVWACVGDNIGRWLLLSAVTLTAVMWIVNAVFILSNMELSGSERPSVIGFISRGVISLVLNWWYFNRKTTVAYYKRDVANWTTCAELIVGRERNQIVSQRQLAW